MKILTFVLFLMLPLASFAQEPLMDEFEDTPEFLSGESSENPELSKNAETTKRSILFKLIQKSGGLVISSLNTKLRLKPASTMKLFTGWMAFEERARAETYLSTMLKESNNQMAQDTLVKMGGKASLKNYYVNLGLPVDSSNFICADGSGLSYDNQANCAVEVALLENIYRSGQYNNFKKLLAKPGEHGTLSKRLLSMKGKVFAKTGTLRSTAALAGFLETSKGVVAFCMLSDFISTSLATERANIDQMLINNYKKLQ